MSVFKKHAFFGNPIDIRRLDQVIDRALAIEMLIKAAIAPHIIGKEKQNIGSLGFGRGKVGKDT